MSTLHSTTGVGLGLALAVALAACGRPAPASGTYQTERMQVRIVTVASGLESPWGFVFLPDGDILVTEKPGRLRRIHDGRLDPQPIAGVPAVDAGGQDGLLDIALHPRFAENHFVYLTYTKGGDRGNTPALARGRLDGTTLADVRDLFVADAWLSGGGGNTGSRIAFLGDGTLLMSVGERHEQTPAQDLGTHKGKIVRLRDDGSVPVDNPFVGRAGARPEIYALGVRNPQGLFVDSATGTIWEVEHGPRGGDELNVIEAGHNLGFPTITYGRNYDFSSISAETARAGMDQPFTSWVPSISPSGLTLYTGDTLPEWRGNLFLGALSGQHLRRIEINGRTVVNQEVLDVAPFDRRIRDVRQGPDGYLYVLTDGAGTLFRIEPVR